MSWKVQKEMQVKGMDECDESFIRIVLKKLIYQEFARLITKRSGSRPVSSLEHCAQLIFPGGRKKF